MWCFSLCSNQIVNISADNMLKLFLWLRYLRKRKIVFLSIAAVALSCTLLIVVASLFNGFIKAEQQYSRRLLGDIILYCYPRPIGQYDKLIEQLEEASDIKAAAPSLFSFALLYLGTGDVRKVALYGIDPRREAKITDIADSLIRQNGDSNDLSFEVPGRPEENGCWLGIRVLAEPDEKTDEYDFDEVKKYIGSQVVLMTGTVKERSDKSDRSSRRLTFFKPKTFKLRIADVFHSGHYYNDSAAYLPIKQLYRLIHPDEPELNIHFVRIKLQSGLVAEEMLEPVRRVWENFAKSTLGWDEAAIANARIETSLEYQADYYAELHKQMGVLMLIFGIISSIGVLLMFCIFYMIVTAKRKDIAIIKSCGSTGSSVAAIFIGFGACVGIAGVSLGTILGYIVVRNIDALEKWINVIFGWKIWRSSVYVFDKIPNEVDWNSVWPIVLAAVIASMAGAALPAIVAARTKPVKILRYE